MTVREDIAAAASSVEGVSVSPYFRQVVKPGEGMVRLARRSRDDSGLGFIDTWQVWIAGSQDVAITEKSIEQMMPALITSLSEVMVITTITPSELVFQNITVPGVIYEGAREGE